MKPNLLKDEWLQWLILAAPFCAAALLWDRLPERVPIHWNAQGHVDGYAARGIGVVLVPVTNVVLTLLLAVLPWLDPKLRRQEGEARASLARTLRIVRQAITGIVSHHTHRMLGAAGGVFGEDSATSSMPAPRCCSSCWAIS
jgi:uncharacterized membrane protein